MLFDRIKNIARSYVHDFLEDDESLERERHRLDEEYEKAFGANAKQESYNNNYQSQNNSETQLEAEHYKALELPVGASFEQIKAQYRSLIKKYHPDKFRDPAKHKDALAITQKLNQAYAYFKKKFKK